MINSNLAIDNANTSNYVQSSNDISEKSFFSNLFSLNDDDSNADGINLSKVVLEKVKKEEQIGKDFLKDTFNSFTKNDEGNFSLWKTGTNAFCVNLLPPFSWIAAGVKLVGGYMSKRIDSM